MSKTTPLPSYGIWKTDIVGKRVMGFTPEQFLSVWQARADLEAENQRLREALHRIDSIAVFLPAFEVLHEGGIEAVTQNIVEAIKATCTALESNHD